MLASYVASPTAGVSTNMSANVVEVATRVLARVPQWIRHDLVSAEPAARTRAEEALAAMIGAALEEQTELGPAG